MCLAPASYIAAAECAGGQPFGLMTKAEKQEAQ